MSRNLKRALITGVLALSFGLCHNVSAYTPPFLNDEHYQKGIISLASNNYSDAIIELNQAISKFPAIVEIRNNLSDAYYKRGVDSLGVGNCKNAANDFRAAIFYMKYFQEPNPIDLEKVVISENLLKNCLKEQNISTSPKSRFNEGKKLRGQGLFTQSVVEFAEASKDPESRALALENIGDLMVIMNNTQRAVNAYENALEIAPLNYGLHLKLAEILDKIDVTDRAIEEYNLALGDNEYSEEIMLALERLANLNVKKFPDRAVSYLNLGAVYQRKGDFVTAMTYYEKARALDSANPVVKINIGSLYQAQGNCLKAIEVYNEVISVCPQDSLAYLYRARAYSQLKNYAEAIKSYEEILKLDPKNAQAKSEMLDTIANLPDTDAVAYFEKLVAQFPNDGEILQYYADSLLKKGLFYKATLQYQKLIVKDGSNIPAYIALAKSYQGLYDFDNAIKTVDNGIFRNPDDKKLPAFKAELLEGKDDMLIKQGFEFYQKGNITKAIETYKLIQDPTKDVFVNIAACYQKMGKYQEAADNYGKALALSPDDVDVLCYMGNISCLQSHFDLATTYYKRALAIDPASQDAQKGLKLASQGRSDWLLQQGMDQYKAMDYKKSLKTLSQLLTLDPQNAYGHYYRALTYDAMNDPRKAIEDYVAVTKQMPKMEIVYYSLGVDYDTVSDFKNAVVAYRKFIELSGTKVTEYTKYAKKRLIDLKNVK